MAKLYDRVEHTFTQTSNRVFALSAVTGRESLSNGDTDVLVAISDTAGAYAVVVGNVAAGSFNVEYIISSSTGLEVLPTFGAGGRLFCSNDSTSINKAAQGKGGLTYMGQSNAVGNSPNNDPLKEIDDPRITQFKFQFDPLDPRGTNYDPNEYLLHREPVFFNEQSARGADNVGNHKHFASWLVNNGHRNICLLPAAEGGAAFETFPLDATKNNLWKANDPLAVRCKDMIVQFLNDDPNNYLAAIVWQHGESDSYTGAGMTENTYAGHFDTLFDWLINEVRTGTTNSYDIQAEAVPILVVGMPQQFVTGGNYAGTVQDALIDTPNRRKWSAFVDISSYTGADPLHNNEATNRAIGSELLPAAFIEAKKNYLAGVTAITGTINQTLDGILAALAGNVVNPAGVVTGTLSETFDNDYSTASGTAAAGSQTPLTDALAPIVQLRRGVAVTESGGLVSNWADQSGNSNDGAQATADEQPTWNGTDIVFSATPFQTPNVTDGLSFSNAIFNIVDKWTLIIDYQYDAAAGDYILFGGVGTFANPNASGGTVRVRATSHGDNDITLPATFTDSSRHQFALVVDVTGNTITAYLDGSQIDQITSPNWTNSPDGSSSAVGRNGASVTFGADATIYNFTVFNDKALSLSDINNVVSEYS